MHDGDFENQPDKDSSAVPSLVLEAYDFLASRYGSNQDPNHFEKLNDTNAAPGTVYDITGKEIDPTQQLEGGVVFRTIKSEAGEHSFEILKVVRNGESLELAVAGQLDVAAKVDAEGRLVESRSVQIKDGDSFVEAAAGTTKLQAGENNSFEIELTLAEMTLRAAIVQNDVKTMSVQTSEGNEFEFTFENGALTEILVDKKVPDAPGNLPALAIAARKEILAAHGFSAERGSDACLSDEEGTDGKPRPAGEPAVTRVNTGEALMPTPGPAPIEAAPKSDEGTDATAVKGLPETEYSPVSTIAAETTDFTDDPSTTTGDAPPADAELDFTRFKGLDLHEINDFKRPQDRLAAKLIYAYEQLKSASPANQGMRADFINVSLANMNSALRTEVVTPEFARQLQEFIRTEFADVKFPDGKTPLAIDLNPVRPALPEAFALTNNQDTVKEVLDRLRAGTSHWTDISEHREVIESWLRDKKHLDESLKEEAERIKGNCPKGMTPLEYAESLARQGKGNAELAEAYAEIMGNRPPIMDEVGRRLADLQRASDLISDSQGRPRTKVTFDLVGAEGRYKFGENVTDVRAADLLEKDSSEVMRKAFAHELVHQNQDISIIRAIARGLAQKEPGFDAKTPEGIRKIQAEYRRLTTNELNAGFAESVIRKYESTPMSPPEVERGLAVAADLKDFYEKTAPINDKISKVQDAINRVFEKPGEFFKELQDPDRRQELFGEKNPPWLDRLFKQKEKGVINAAEVSMGTVDALSIEIEKLKAEWEKFYDASLVEREAFKVSAMAETAEANAPADLAADKARATALLDGKAAQPGDPLHPNSRNSAKLRAAYDAAINNGTFTSKDVEKLLSLKPETRGDVEFLLHQGRLSPPAWQRLTMLTADQIGKFLEIPGKEVAVALEKGLIDGRCIELMAAKPEHQTPLDEFIRTVSGKPGMTPESFLQLLEMSPSQRKAFLTDVAKAGPNLNPADVHSALLLGTNKGVNALSI
ncbi:MAG: hypothetical protein K2Z81_04755, partial [Cyanobacteria bacterium]|nr:hypothetical protein [Cyanobacteriota bacterium]